MHITATDSAARVGIAVTVVVADLCEFDEATREALRKEYVEVGHAVRGDRPETAEMTRDDVIRMMTMRLKIVVRELERYEEEHKCTQGTPPPSGTAGMK